MSFHWPFRRRSPRPKMRPSSRITAQYRPWLEVLETRCAPAVITEFPVLTAGSDPFGITAGPDGNLWFTEQIGDKIGRITPSGTVTEFTTGITASSAPV